jgi:UDP-glucuronate 4-epimerase
METILVTGGAGFIGSHLCEALLKKGHKVVAIDNLHPYYDPKIKLKNLAILKKHKGFGFYKVDLRSFGALKGVFSKHKFDRVAHIGGNGGVRASLDDPRYYQETIVGGTLNMLMLSKGVKVFVYASSSSVYGSRMKVPFREDEPVERPQSPYAACKRAAELMCCAWHELYRLNITCLRFFTVYGPRGRPDMAPYKFLKAIDSGLPIPRYGNGTSKRDYTYIADVIQGVLAALEKPMGFEIINLGNNNPVSLNDFIATIEKVTGKKARIIEEPMPKADVPITFADITKARRLLGFSPKTNVEEGMRKFYEWYREN